MRKSRFSDEQIIGILKEHQAGMPVADVCRKHGISDATLYAWRSKYGGMEVSDARKLKTLEDENRRLKNKSAIRQVALHPNVLELGFLDYVEQNNYMQFEALNEKDLSDLIDSAVALAGRGEELRRRTELLNRQEDNNRATAARLLGKE